MDESEDDEEIEEIDPEELSKLPDLSGNAKPVISGDTPEWFTGADAYILFVMYSGLVLSPSIIAENTGVSRVTVSRRLNTLQAADYVEKVGRGKYKITPDGAFAVTGDPAVYPDVSYNAEKDEYESDAKKNESE